MVTLQKMRRQQQLHHLSTLFASPTSSPPATNLALISSTGAARPTMTAMGSGGEAHPTAAAVTTGVASLPSLPSSVSVPPPVPSCSQASTVTIADDDGGGGAIKSPAHGLTGTSGHGRELSPPDSNIAEESKEPATDVDDDDYLDITNIPLALTVADETKKEGNEGDSHTNQIVHGKKRVMVEVADAEREPEPKRARVVGLKNLGNTCYNNAVIQALSHTTLLRDYFIARETPEALHPLVSQLPVKTAGRPRTRREARLQEQLVTENSVDVNLCNEFSKLLRSMWGVGILTTERRRRNPGRAATVVSPSAFADAVSALLPLFHERYEQQDAQEFLRCALEQMHLELSLEKGDQASMDADNTIVNRVFGGVLWNKISCLSCCNYTIKADPFLDLSLVIPEGRDQVALEDCIDLFSLSEELESTASGSPSSPSSPASRTCMTCGSDQGFSRSIKLGELPCVLCIHLKRFRWRRNGKQKVNTPVRFPLQDLDMSRWLDDIDECTGEGLQRLYELYTVVIHQGNGANSGHYYAYVKDGEQWWSINDERAFRVQQDQVRKAKAYLLFYRPQETAISTPGSTMEDHSTATTAPATAHH